MEEEDSTNQKKEQPNGIKDEKKENIPEGSEGSNEADEKDEILSPEEKIQELEDKLLRNVAEMDNIRKRSEKERTEAYKIGASIFIKEMLPIIDKPLVQYAVEEAIDIGIEESFLLPAMINFQ